MRRFVESGFHGSDKGKCAVFAIYAHILYTVACSFLDFPAKHDPKRLIASVESITKSVGQSKMKDAGEIVKIARTAHRVASQAAHDGEQLGEFPGGESIDFCLVFLDTGGLEWFGLVEANHRELVFGRVDVFGGEKFGGPNKLRDVVKEFLPKFRCDWLVGVDCVHIDALN